MSLLLEVVLVDQVSQQVRALGLSKLGELEELGEQEELALPALEALLARLAWALVVLRVLA